MSYVIRLVEKSDSEAILKIYAPFIENTAFTFETQVHKFEQWYDVTWLERNIIEYCEKPKVIKLITDLTADEIENVFKK